MIKEFEEVRKEFEKLPKAKQKELSQKWLDEIKWQIRFQNSEDELLTLANEALEEYKRGGTEDL